MGNENTTTKTAFEPGARHEEILRALSRHRLLSSDLIERIDGGSGQKLRKKILPQLLEHRYVRIKENRSVNQSFVYSLDTRGVRHLSTHCGIPRNLIAHHPRGGEFIGHTLLTADIMIAFEQACEASDQVELIPPEEILYRAPSETRQSRSPFSWPISFEYDGITIDKPIVPDKIFGLRRLDLPEDESEFFFCLEADTGSETIRSRRLKYSTTWFGKSLQYKATHQGSVFPKRYNIDAFRVLLVTNPSVKYPGQHLRKMREATQDAYDGHATRLFLFTTYAQFQKQSPLDLEWLQADATRKRLLPD